MPDKFIRKSVVYNTESAWHMAIYKRVMKESNNHSGYVLSILKEHFDSKPELELELEVDQQPETKKEPPKKEARLKTVNVPPSPPKIFKPN